MNEKRKLTGEEVGRLVLKDLAAVHINNRPGLRNGPPLPVMTPAEKAALVNSLTEPAEVAAYNDYRYFHEFLSRATLYFNVHQQNSDSRFWQIYGRLEVLELAELENAHVLVTMPKIMTRSQYDQARNLFNPSGGEGFGRGVAIVETEGFAEGTYPLTRGGQFQYTIPGAREASMAEKFLADGPGFAALLASYRASVKEALVIKAAFEVFGKFLGVPELGDIIPDLELKRAENLNRLMAGLPPIIIRRGLLPDERPEGELKAELSELLQPIDLKHLRPSAKLRAKALKAMDFAVAQGQSEKIYEILRREDEK